MIDWFRFVKGNKRLLNFGFIFNFFSSFGQTFFISLFVPYWISTFGITNAFFGGMYATVTILSAFLLTWAGSFIDNVSLRKYGFLVTAGLVLSVIFLSQSYNVWMLIIGLLFVRWFGQGMMTHTSSTGIAKLFDDDRGKALGFTALGHPAGQFLIPLFISPLIIFAGWRVALLIMAGLAALIIAPTIRSIGTVERYHASKNQIGENVVVEVNYLKTIKFWVIAVNIFVIPFLITAVLLYQFSIAESKGWDRAWVTFSFAFFAVSNAIALLISGNLVDRYSGKTLFPLYLIPSFIAFLLMSFVNSAWIFPLFYALLGMSTGLGSTIKTAMQVEIYGKGRLGKIRSYFSTILVFSTALGPPAFGFFIDRNFAFDTVMVISAICISLIILLSFKVRKM